MQAEARFVSPAMKRTSDWILSQELPSDITIKVDDAAFNLHKLPLASRCGYIKKQVSGVGGNKATHLEIAGMPGGSKSFELVVKFCYGVNFEITVDNVAMLRCAGEHLEMTEECRPGNLVGRTEAYLEEVALASLEGAVAVLRKAEELLPASEEKARLVARCIDAVASIVCGGDGQFSMSLGTPGGGGGGGYNGVGAAASREVDDWCADELTALRIDTFQRVMIAMKARGFKGIAMGTLIMLYAQKSLRRLDMHGRDRKKMGARQEHEKRVVLETIMRLRDPSVAFSAGGVPPSGRPPLPKKPGGGGGGSSGGFMNSMSKKLGRLNPFLRSDVLGGGRVRTKPPKDRRHSIS
uniref:BTB domain-containing protein n=2 Tax=Oryza TaxID=4527 RepID=A0A0D3FF78_9ORYZ